MTNLKIRKTLVALLFGMTAVLNSCVQEDWYELYDMDDVALSIRRKKNKSDIDFESNKITYFNDYENIHIFFVFCGNTGNIVM